MTKFLALIATLAIASTCYCQTVGFTYDASGNRIARFQVKEVKQSAADTTLLPEFKPTDEVELLSEVTVYPNPVKQNLHLHITRLGDATATAHLCDISGRPVLSFGNLTAANILGVESLAPGTYILRVECKGERRVWKIVISD
jgi:hypothetical protein